MASDLSGLDLLVIQMDDILMDEDLILVGWRVAAIGVDAKGDKHSLGLIAHQAGHNDLAADIIGQAIALNDRVRSEERRVGKEC